MNRWVRWGVPFAGCPLVMWLVWFWLGVAERDSGDLILSVLLGAAIVGVLTGLVWTAFGGSVLRAFGFVVLVMILASMNQWGANLKGSIPWLLRAAVLVLAAVILAIVPMRNAALLRDWRYWAAWAVFTIGSYMVPAWLVNWVPQLKSLTAQTTSMVLRFGLAYTIALGTFTVFADFVRRMAEHPTAARTEA